MIDSNHNHNRNDDDKEDATSILTTLCALYSNNTNNSYDELCQLFSLMDQLDNSSDDSSHGHTQVLLSSLEDDRVKQLLCKLFMNHWNHVIECVDENQLLFRKRSHPLLYSRETGDDGQVVYRNDGATAQPAFVTQMKLQSSSLTNSTNERGTTIARTLGSQSDSLLSEFKSIIPDSISFEEDSQSQQQERIRRQVQEYNEKHRSKSLFEINQEISDQKKKDYERREKKRRRREEKEARKQKRKHHQYDSEEDRRKRKRRHRYSDSSSDEESDSDESDYSSSDEEEYRRRKRKSRRESDKKDRDRSHHKKKEKKHRSKEKSSSERKKKKREKSHSDSGSESDSERNYLLQKKG